MIFYFLRKYISLWIVLCLSMGGMVMFFASFEISYLIPRVVFWTGFITAFQLYREFNNKNLWPLYDNLRISRFLLLGSMIVINFVLTIGLQLWLR